ncbi:hypothetical protein EV202_1373 [Bacteroides heparinolyticus]|uniref:Bacteroidetes PKD-like domain-containing protein n=1 Tax=Prevotella heparinolytica TaxID=28113 RepID=A0A4R2LGF9_9BACE|nr:hypothetical protein [Bacteroides heparinolyticus]TCO86994.1 hypothetical protein EV202_1373 [Bacteroides heparinolyticus]
MKKIYIMLLTMLAFNALFTGCSTEEPFSTATVNDDPRILDPIFPDRINGNLPTVANFRRDGKFSMKLTVTPADYTTVKWLIDGEEVATGTEIEKEFLTGTYHLKITATTDTGKSTYREGIIQVNPLADDPDAISVGFERIVSPGNKACFYGNNLNKVKGILIGGTPATDVTYVETEEGAYVEYTVPAELSEGDYRVRLVDAAGMEYGANTVKLTKGAMITAGADRATAAAEWVMTGINLDAVASITVKDVEVTKFVEQTAGTLKLVCPELAEGTYKVTGNTRSGESVQFYTNGEVATELTVTISAEKALWAGHHYVSWDKPDGDPNKTFNLIPKDVMVAIKPGSILRVYYSVEPSAEYHQLQLATGWWTGLMDKIEFGAGGVYALTITQEIIDRMNEQDGFLCVGHGYYVDLVTIQ